MQVVSKSFRRPFISWLLLWLLACGPAVGLEVHLMGSRPDLVAESSTRGFSSGEEYLTWWDLVKNRPLKVLKEPICVTPLTEAIPTFITAMPPPRTSYQQFGDLLFSWCRGDDVLSQWHLPSGTLLKRLNLKGMVPLSSELLPGYSSSPAWISDGYVLMKQQRELIRLFDETGQLLKEREIDSRVEQLWMNEQYVVSRTRQSIQLWRVPDLQPVRTFTLSSQEQVLGLIKNRLISRISQPLCSDTQQSLPLNMGLNCRKKDEPQTAILRYWDLENGRLASQQQITGAQDIGVSTDYSWALFGKELRIFNEQGKTSKKLSLTGMRYALLNGPFGVAWSHNSLCSLDLEQLRQPACQALKGDPDNIVLTDKYVYTNQQKNYDWSKWRAFSLPDLKDLGPPQNLVGSNAYPEALTNPAPTPMFRAEANTSHLLGQSVFELDGLKFIRSFRPFNLRLGDTARHGRLLAASGIQQRFLTYDLASGRTLGSWPSQELIPSWTAISGRRLITISDDPLQPMIKVYGLPDLRLETELDGNTFPIELAEVFGSLLLTSDGQELRLWDLEQRRLKDSLKLQDCAPRGLLYQAPRLIYLCEGQQLDYDDNGGGRIRRNTGQYQLLLLRADQGRFRLLDRFRSSEQLWRLNKWEGNELTLGHGQQFDLQNDHLRPIPAKPQAQTWQFLLGTWPEIILQEQTPDVSSLRIFSALEDYTQARILPNRLKGNGNWQERLVATSDHLIQLSPAGPNQAAQGLSQHLKTGVLESVSLSGNEFPLGFRNNSLKEVRQQLGAWTLMIKQNCVVARNPKLKIENRFFYPGQAQKSPVSPTVWLEDNDKFLIRWESGNLIQRCSLHGNCSETQTLPWNLGNLVKVGNRLIGWVSFLNEDATNNGTPGTALSPLPNRYMLWIWDAESLELLQVIPLANDTRLVEVSPPGTITLFRASSPQEMGFARHQILRLADGKILGTYYSLVRPEGMLIMTEDGYYAGTGNYRDLVYLQDGAREFGLKDFPGFHRPDLVWQLLQGKVVDKQPGMPGLQWGAFP